MSLTGWGSVGGGGSGLWIMEAYGEREGWLNFNQLSSYSLNAVFKESFSTVGHPRFHQTEIHDPTPTWGPRAHLLPYGSLWQRDKLLAKAWEESPSAHSTNDSACAIVLSDQITASLYSQLSQRSLSAPLSTHFHWGSIAFFVVVVRLVMGHIVVMA